MAASDDDINHKKTEGLPQGSTSNDDAGGEDGTLGELIEAERERLRAFNDAARALYTRMGIALAVFFGTGAVLGLLLGFVWPLALIFGFGVAVVFAVPLRRTYLTRAEARVREQVTAECEAAGLDLEALVRASIVTYRFEFFVKLFVRVAGRGLDDGEVT